MSLFDDADVFLLAEFTFPVAESFLRSEDNNNFLVDDRGNRQAIAKFTDVKFKLTPIGANTSTDLKRPSSYTERYTALVVSSEEGVSLPSGIFPGDSGQGEIRGRTCTCTIESLQQSGVAPAIAGILGDKVILSVQYNQGSGNAVDF